MMKKVISIVEDEKDLNELVKRYLEKEGYECTSFYTYDEALMHCDDDVHLWILDIMLGDKSGFDLIEQIRMNDPNVPVIFMSARDKEFEKTGDGLVTALMFLKVMKETGLTALELCEGLKIYPQLLINVKVSDKNAAMEDSDVNKAIEEVNSRLNGNGRILVRQSGTEPLVRVMAEAETDEICEREVNSIVEIVKNKFGI